MLVKDISNATQSEQTSTSSQFLPKANCIPVHLANRLFSMIAVWGPDPKFNPRLALILSNAKRAEIPKSVIEGAIARGRGISATGQALEQVTIEAMLPASVAAVIECQTDQKGRTLQDVRHTIKELGGTVTPTTYLFEKRGRIVFERRHGLNADDYLDQAIEAGAADIVVDERGRLVIFTEPAETKRAAEAFSKATGLAVEQLEMIWDPNKDTSVDLKDDEQARNIEDMLNTIREDTSVRDIYVNTARVF